MKRLNAFFQRNSLAIIGSLSLTLLFTMVEMKFVKQPSNVPVKDLWYDVLKPMIEEWKHDN